ncbi:MAG: substrate-binding periplasmic protein [Candidatus Bathyarchaeia archaeon]|nr:amino acid ABC transporter substrate-binding protein [Candidatus Bathyarchaeota archaeon A05DMB-4]MDH7595110.1 ABC transporter substrate-binding protein [Candidatus Bathyarchaeota archaeon]
MVAQKYVTAIGMIIIAVLAFVVGLYASPYVLRSLGVPEDPVWNNIVSTGIIRVGTEPGWPPYEFLNETTNEIIGFEVELMEMIADKLNLTVDWRDTAFDDIITSVQSGKLDLGVSGFSVTPERLEVVQFTMHHSITEGQIIMNKTRRDNKGITMLTSLENLTALNLHVGVQVGTTQESELLDTIPSGLVHSYSDYVDALTAMKTGLIDCVYAETPITSNWILEAEQQGEPPLVVIFRRPYWPVAFVAHKDAHILVAKINGALAEIIASGELDALKQKWKC